jgi:hypothetical protein
MAVDVLPWIDPRFLFEEFRRSGVPPAPRPVTSPIFLLGGAPPPSGSEAAALRIYIM